MLVRRPKLVLLAPALFAIALGAATPALAQFGPPGPPAVGVVKAQKQPITETSEFVGRVQALDKVDLLARVTGTLVERLFTEGAEVKQGDVLFRIDRAPFEADLQAKQASVAQMNALLVNAQEKLSRAQTLLNSPAGSRSNLDDALAQQRSQAAQLLGAQAQVTQSQINLGYTEIRAPIAGKIGRAAVSVGNIVSPTSGPLATIVSQDPMNVVFPVSVRTVSDLRSRYREGFAALALRLRLPDGRMLEQKGRLNFIDNTITAATDTLTLRGEIANPAMGAATGSLGNRALVDGQFVTVLVDGVEPVLALSLPRAAVLSDQQGDYIFVVGAENKVEQRRIKLGQSTPATAVVVNGLAEGEQVIVEGVQRVRPGIAVNPGPVAPGPSAPGAAAPGAAPAAAR